MITILMNLLLRAQGSKHATGSHIEITGSKSESNRLLILQQQFANLTIRNLSNSDDTHHLQNALKSKERVLDIGHAGTAMRFLTAYLANQPGREVILTGSDRMKQRPIGILVNALRDLGAHIHYVEKEGYPPLKISGRSLQGGEVDMDAGISSQFLSALLLIGSQMQDGLCLKLNGNLTSRPYLEMTTQLLQKIGLKVDFTDQQINIEPQRQVATQQVTVESDWSSAGYWYSWCALQHTGYKITLSSYQKQSLQGDAQLAKIYQALGVTTTFIDHSITLEKVAHFTLPSRLKFDLTEQPDQAQTIFATCIGLGVNLNLTGLHTLRIKETDRIEAMAVEGARFRESDITTTPDSISITFPQNSHFYKAATIDTYNDHRMALAFAPLCLKIDLTINDAGVVSKSYGSYYDDLRTVKVNITEI